MHATRIFAVSPIVFAALFAASAAWADAAPIVLHPGESTYVVSGATRQKVECIGRPNKILGCGCVRNDQSSGDPYLLQITYTSPDWVGGVGTSTLATAPSYAECANLVQLYYQNGSCKADE